MEGKDYRYPVALQWVQGAEELKKVKNALLLYFQSPKQCNGGECAIRDTDCSPGYIVIYFKDKEAQKGVLKKNPHQIPIKDKTTSQDKPPLTLHVFPLDTADPQTMGTAVSSLVGLGDNGASGSSADTDTDHQQAANQSSDIRKRDNSWMANSTFKNGEPKRSNLTDHHNSTGHRKSEKDQSDVGAPEGEKQDNYSSAPRSLNENEFSGYSAIPRNESGSKEGKSRPAAPPENDGASGSSAEAGNIHHSYNSSSHNHLISGTSGSSADKDHQQEANQSSDIQSREHSSLTDPGLMDGDSERSDVNSTRHGERKENRSDRRIDWNEQDNNSSAPKPLRVNEEKKGSGDFVTAWNEPRKNSLSRPLSTEESGRNHPAFPPEIYKDVTARLDKEWFTKALQREIVEKIPSLSIEDKSDVVAVTGTFKEIELAYHYLQRKREPDLDAEKPPEAASDWSSTDSPADQVCFPSALYEYIMEIYRTEIEKIQRRYGVKIDHRSTLEGSTFVRFIPQGPDSSPEKAKEKFTDTVQKVMDDWTQVIVDPSVVPLTISDIKERVKAKWSNTLAIQEKNMDIILRGPREELSQVKMFLETTDHKPARPPRSVTISTSNMKTEIEVDVRHMDILKKLKHREISDIEKKYNVKIEEKSKNGGSLVTFRTMNAPPDLSPHASHSFITLLQKTFFNIERKEISVKPEIQEERVNIVQEQLMMAGIDIVMECSTGTVLLIGHPVHVTFAEERLNGRQNPGRGQAAGASEEKMETGSSSANTQKAEEPDKCPICLCEIEEKVTLKCKHAYCKECLKKAMAHKPVCAICGVPYGTVTGDQPDGTMTWKTYNFTLKGYSGCGTIEINYYIPGGIQKENHPHPGRHFSGAQRTAYLPDNKEGNEILRLLKKAFDQKLIFTVGDSRTSGATDTVTWNDVHHKTSTHGGPQNFGYPDPDYLNRVRDELKAKGVV